MRLLSFGFYFLCIIGFGSAHNQDGPVVMLTHYSDAQCPCSARVPSDYKEHFLDNADFDGLVDFQQFFVGDLTKNPHKCIHGEGECVAQRHFACAQHMSTQHKLSYRDSPKWLDFEACSYGKCTDCAAILGPHCPCRTYSIFNEYEKNDIMKNCSTEVGLDWTELHQCAINGTGEALMAISAERSNADNITYGVDGLAPIYVNGVKVKTEEPIPVVCGPVPKETHNKVCAVLLATHGLTPPACKGQKPTQQREQEQAGECPLKPTTTVAYYGGHGATDDCQDWEQHFFDWWAASDAAIKVERVLPSKLHKGGLQHCQNLRVWAQPGGNAYDQQTSLGPQGKAALLEYIQHGNGAYLGTCAGWYVSASDYWWEGQHYQWPNMLNVFPTVEGSISDIWDDKNPPGYALTHVNTDNQTLRVLYWGGPTRDWRNTSPYSGTGRRVLTFSTVKSKGGGGGGHPPAGIIDGNKLFLSVHLEAYEGHPNGVSLSPTDRLANYKMRAALLNSVTKAGWIIPDQ